MNEIVIPNNKLLIEDARKRGVEVIFARIACQKTDGRDRSLSQKKPGASVSQTRRILFAAALSPLAWRYISKENMTGTVHYPWCVVQASITCCCRRIGRTHRSLTS
eukprot:COSAG02_NODE_201_length_29473_cov_135.510213_15_plen_106_part_00